MLLSLMGRPDGLFLAVVKTLERTVLTLQVGYNDSRRWCTENVTSQMFHRHTYAHKQASVFFLVYQAVSSSWYCVMQFYMSVNFF